MCFTQFGSGLTNKHQIRLEKLAKDKPSSVLQKFVNYGRKKFYYIDHKAYLGKDTAPHLNVNKSIFA